MITQETLRAVGKILKDKEEEYFRYLKARTRLRHFKVDISHQNLTTDKGFNLNGLDINDYKQLLEDFKKLGVICPSSKDPQKLEWIYRPESLGKLYFGEVSAPDPVLEMKPKTANASAHIAQGAESGPTPLASRSRPKSDLRSSESLTVELQTKSGFVIRFEVPKTFSSSDARRLKAMIDAQVVVSDE